MRKNNDGRFVFEWDDVFDVIYSLSHSQGFYGRLLRDLEELRNEDEEAWERFVGVVEDKEFTSALDVVLFFEG